MENFQEKQCHFCEQHSSSLLLCPRCKSTSYCSREHRMKDWKLHKRICTGRNAPVSHVQAHFPTIRSHEGTETITEYIVRNLYEKDYCIIDNFHLSNLAFYILGEVKSLHHWGAFSDGEVVSSDGFGRKDKKIREDQISWVTGKEPYCQAIGRHMAARDALMAKCNLLIRENDIRKRTKAMVACYPGKGAHFKRHIDNPNGDGRCISTLYYLNQNWTEEDGGAMHLYPRGRKAAIKILPSFDRLLLFWSDKRNPHEVQPTYKVRYSITLWYFDTAERARYHEKLRKQAAET